MKILYITEMNLSAKDAPPIHIKEVINNLSELDNDLFLIVPKLGEIDVKAKVNYLKVPKSDLLKRFFFNLNLLFILPFYVRANEIEAIYTRQGITLVAPMLISKIFSIPYITEVNGITEEEMKLEKNKGIFIGMVKIMEKFIYKNAEKIISVTPSIKRYIMKKYKISSDKIVVLENGVNTNLFEPKKLKQKYDLFFVGNIAPWQGLKYLVEGVYFVKRENKEIKVVIVGEGSEKNELIRLTKQFGLEKNILFLGSKPHEKIPKYINESNICVAPFTLNCRNKKSGISAFKIYEYASCGRPIITTNLKGVSNFVNKNSCGLVVEPNNPKALADAIIKLLNNPKIAEEMGRNGRKTILNGYSWKNVAERTQKVIKDTIKLNKR